MISTDRVNGSGSLGPGWGAVRVNVQVETVEHNVTIVLMDLANRR